MKMPNRKRRPWERDPKPRGVQMGRRVDNQDFYNSTAWRKASKAYRAKHPICAECERQGKVGPAEVVDHIIPIRKGGDRWDSENWQSMCHPCHNKKSAKEAHG